MWYVRFRSIEPARSPFIFSFKWIQYPSFMQAAAGARRLHEVGWKEIHLTKVQHAKTRGSTIQFAEVDDYFDNVFKS